jgi:hypothetical protein
MSVLANTLNAYAGKIKAQRKAAERVAQAQARAKSAEQRLADKMRVEAERLQKQAEANAVITPTQGVEFVVDSVIRKIKNEYNEVLLSGERAKITRDLSKLTELYYYKGTIPGRIAHVVVDAKTYSKAAMATMIGSMLTLDMMQREGADDIVLGTARTIVCLRNNVKVSISFYDPLTTSIEEAKEDFLDACRNDIDGVVIGRRKEVA